MRCDWPWCRKRSIHLTYRGKPLCRRHWREACELSLAKRERVLGLKPCALADAACSIVLRPWAG